MIALILLSIITLIMVLLFIISLLIHKKLTRKEDEKMSLIKLLLVAISYYTPERGFTLDGKVDPEELKTKVQQAKKFSSKIVNLIKYGKTKSE